VEHLSEFVIPHSFHSYLVKITSRLVCFGVSSICTDRLFAVIGESAVHGSQYRLFL